MLHILSRDEPKYSRITTHLNKMLKCYIAEVAKMDAEIGAALNVKATMKPDAEPSDLNKLQPGKIYNEHWSVVYRSKEGDTVKRKIFFLRDKHLYRTAALEAILALIEANKANSESDKKCFADMLKWYLVFRNTLLNLMQRLFRIVKRED